MKSRWTHFLTAARNVALLALSATAAESAHAQDYLYVGDYSGNQVVRFNGDTGAPVNPTPFISLTGAEGVGGVDKVTLNGHYYANTLSVASGVHTINTYDISNPTVSPGLISSISTPGWSGLRIAFSNNGNTLYSGGYLGNNGAAGELRAYQFGTSTELNHIDNNNNGIWGVAVNPQNGRVYWTTGWTGNSGGGIYSANPDLTGVTQIAAPGAHGATGLVGITFKPDGTFYVVNGGNGDPNNDFILHYKADGTFLDRVDMTGMPSNALYNAFDTEIGPDGGLYVTSQNGACAVEFNDSTDTYDRIFVPPHAGGLQQAKTIHFSTNSVVSGVPEPGVIALLLACGLTGGRLLLRRRK